MNILRKYLTETIAIATIIIGLLVIANLIKLGYISKDIITANKDFINTLGEIITIFAISIGGVFSYYRFFKGRVFSNNATIEVRVTIHKSSGDFLLHVIDISLKNEGAFPIWEPTPHIVAYPHGLTELGEAISVENWESVLRKSPNYVNVIDPLETEQFYAFHKVQKSIMAITYAIQIKSRKKEKWIKNITVTNELKDE